MPVSEGIRALSHAGALKKAVVDRADAYGTRHQPFETGFSTDLKPGISRTFVRKPAA
jgi:hypothetical protein